MNDISTFLKQRIRAYNAIWTYTPGNDMAACLIDILQEYFITQQHCIEQIPKQKQNIMWNQLCFPEEVQTDRYLQIACQSDTRQVLEAFTTLYAQDASGAQAIYELLQDTYSYHTYIERIIGVDATTQKICEIANERPQDVTLTLDKEDAQFHALYFYIPHVFDYCENLAFDLCLSCEDALLDYLVQPALTKLYLDIAGQQVELHRITRKQDAIHIEIDLEEEDRLAITGLWIQGINLSRLSAKRIWDASFVWQGHKLHCDYIFGEEQAYEEDEFPLFGSPMNMFNSCYISENECLSNPDATICLRFYIVTQCLDQGMELLQQQDYRGVMRKLPLELPVYDAYADIVVMEYFNGESWCMLPHTQGIQTIFTKAEKSAFQIEFKRPQDLQPCVIMGKEAYYIRFRLVKSDHLYQQPCHIHVPYISRIRFQYTMRQHRRAPQTFLYAQMHKENISNRLGHDECIIFPRLQAMGKAVFIALKDIVFGAPCTLYVDINSSQASGSPLHIACAKQNEEFQDIHIMDGSEGLTHSGELTIMLPEQMYLTTLFEEEAYWLRLSFEDDQWHDIQLHQILFHSAQIRYKEGSLNPVVSLYHRDHDHIKIRPVKGPYGYIAQHDAHALRLRYAHQFTTTLQPVRKADLRQCLLDTFPSIADIVLLEQRTPYDEPSDDCHVVVLLSDIIQHNELFQILKKDILTYLNTYIAYIQGRFQIREPIFVSVSIHAQCYSPQSRLWDKQQELQAFITAFFDPIQGGLYHQGYGIHEYVDMDELQQRCMKYIPDIDIRLWLCHVEYQVHGQYIHCLYREMPTLPGMVLCNGAHHIEMLEMEDEPC